MAFTGGLRMMPLECFHSARHTPFLTGASFSFGRAAIGEQEAARHKVSTD